MSTPTNDGNIVKRTSQYIDNLSFDDATGVRGVAIYGTPDGVNVYRLKINADGAITSAENSYSSTTNSNVSASASSVTIASANTARKELTIFNDSSAILYIKEGTTAATTDYKYILFPYETYRTNNYTGRIDGIWGSATGTARVSES